MDKKDCIKKANIFLKMAEYDFTIIKIVRLIKVISSTALLVNSLVFVMMLLHGVREAKV